MSDVLGLGGKPSENRIVVAMSGGVDSSVAAALMVDAGYDVVGITMQLYDYGMAIGRKGACCAGQDIYDARQVAEKLNFPHYIVNYESRFKQAVIDDFADSYVNGYTPIPCVRCNQTVKFRDLLSAAKDLGAKALVTGHYVQRVMGPQKAELHRGADPSRDQSYFLFATTQEQLDYVRFPLGDLSKTQTREYAHRFNLKNADKPDSQDICFVPDGRYSQVVEKLRPGSVEPGKIVHIDGSILGEHQGTINFTVGQRRGIGVQSQDGEPLYVIKVKPQEKEVIVGPYHVLACESINIADVNWLGDELIIGEPQPIEVKIRSTKPPLPAQLTLLEGGNAHVVFDQLEHGVAPGQACVFYQGDRVLGGGWISR